MRDSVLRLLAAAVLFIGVATAAEAADKTFNQPQWKK
jgi:hypothetical protein